MRYIVEYKIWDIFKKKDKKKKESNLDWETLSIKLVDYYIENDIPTQIKGSFMWEQFPYRLEKSNGQFAYNPSV